MQFFKYLLGDFGTLALQLELTKILVRLGNSHARYRWQVAALNQHKPSVAFESRAGTVGARLRAQVFGELFADMGRFCFAVAALHIGQNAFEWVAAGTRLAAVIYVVKINDFFAAAIQNRVAVLLAKLVKRHVDRKSVVFGE